MLHFRLKRRLIVIGAALFAACAVAAVALSPAVSDEMRPLLQSLGIISCARTGPCQTYSNTSSGAGLEGVSTGGKGIIGQTKFNSTSISNGQVGVQGQDLSTSGTNDAGVKGTSTRGVGVTGTSTSGSGISGISISGVGITAQSTGGTALTARSTNWIALIATANNQPGIIASSVRNDGIDGVTSSPSLTAFGRYGVLGGDSSTDGGTLNRGVEGVSANGIGVEGNSSAAVGVNAIGGKVISLGSDYLPALSDVGNGSAGDLIDVCVTQNPCDFNNAFLSVISGISGPSITTSAFSYFSDMRSSSLDVGNGAPAGLGSINITGTYQKNGSCVAGCVIATATRAGHGVTTYTSMVSQPTIEDFGEAQLVDGQASVRLEAKFANVIEQRANYLVFITPEGDANVLYVTQKSPSSFTVRESRGGRSTIAFSYRIVAQPFGSREARLPMVELPKLHSRSPKPARLFHP